MVVIWIECLHIMIRHLKVLPRFIARIRTGNDEELRFLADLDAKSWIYGVSKFRI